MNENSGAQQFPHFQKPVVQFNATGWGPCELPDTFKDVPYQPFSKSDRLGKICDWTNTSNNDKKYQSKCIEYDLKKEGKRKRKK